MSTILSSPLAHLSPSPTSTSFFSFRTWEDIKNGTAFTGTMRTQIIMMVFFLVMGVMSTFNKYKKAQKIQINKRALPAPGFPPVDELKDFDWQTAEPLKIRPFKPKYHITMAVKKCKVFHDPADETLIRGADDSAIEKLNPDELIIMDKNYEKRIEYRKEKLKTHHDHFVGARESDRSKAAVKELYTFLMGTYLPTRYPYMFQLYEANFDSGKVWMLKNTVSGEMYPAVPRSYTTMIMQLDTLAKTFDEDFLFLLREEDEKAQDSKYRLEAYSVGCPSGWDPKEKLGKRLADIHGPVPGYKSKIEGSMDRFFNKIETGEYVKRVNWSVTTNEELFLPWDHANHAHEGDEIEELKEIDPTKTFVRVERQTLHRLPQSSAIVFAFKTYMYPLTEIKEEGLGEELAQAIDGLKTGNAPGMNFYKRGVVWGEAVKKYLLS